MELHLLVRLKEIIIRLSLPQILELESKLTVLKRARQLEENEPNPINTGQLLKATDDLGDSIAQVLKAL